MGLDTVELVMDVEKTFGVSLPDKECEKVNTVGDLQNLVWKYIQHRPKAHCASQQIFYRLRNLFADHFETGVREVTMNKDPNDIFPRFNRRQRYQHFSETSGLQLPALQLPKQLSFIVFAFAFVFIIGAFFLAFILNEFYNYPGWLYAMPVAGIFLTIFFESLMRPYKTIIPQKDIRAFTFKTLSLNNAALKNISRSDANELVRMLIAESAGADIEKVTVEKSITRDLGLD